MPYGITFIEKHFTLDKSMSGPDHLASIEPDELKHLCIGVRCVEKSLGSNSKVVTASERKNKIVARKSIIAKTEIKKVRFFQKNITTKDLVMVSVRWSGIIYWVKLQSKTLFQMN